MTLPFPIVEMAIEAQNKRRDEELRFHAQINGVKLDDRVGKTVKNDKANVSSIKASMAQHALAKTISRADLIAARNKT